MLAGKRHLWYNVVSSQSIKKQCERIAKWKQKGSKREARIGRGHLTNQVCLLAALCIKFPTLQTAERQVEKDGCFYCREEKNV